MESSGVSIPTRTIRAATSENLKASLKLNVLPTASNTTVGFEFF